jgi:hypothetical protein
MWSLTIIFNGHCENISAKKVVVNTLDIMYRNITQSNKCVVVIANSGGR